MPCAPAVRKVAETARAVNKLTLHI